MKKYGVLVTVCVLLCGTALGAEQPWHLQKDEQGIRIYTRPVEGSPILEFRAETTLEASIEDAVLLYERVDLIPKWFHRCLETQLVEQVSNVESLIYFAVELPWPFFPRDGVYRRIKSLDSSTGAVVYTLHSQPDIYTWRKGRVRVVYLDAEWRFTPLPGGRTLVNYRTHTAPGGYIPPAMMNRFVVPIPFKTFVKFRALLESMKKAPSSAIL